MSQEAENLRLGILRALGDGAWMTSAEISAHIGRWGLRVVPNWGSRASDGVIPRKQFIKALHALTADGKVECQRGWGHKSPNTYRRVCADGDSS